MSCKCKVPLTDMYQVQSANNLDQSHTDDYDHSRNNDSSSYSDKGNDEDELFDTIVNNQALHNMHAPSHLRQKHCLPSYLYEYEVELNQKGKVLVTPTLFLFFSFKSVT